MTMNSVNPGYSPILACSWCWGLRAKEDSNVYIHQRYLRRDECPTRSFFDFSFRAAINFTNMHMLSPPVAECATYTTGHLVSPSATQKSNLCLALIMVIMTMVVNLAAAKVSNFRIYFSIVRNFRTEKVNNDL